VPCNAKRGSDEPARVLTRVRSGWSFFSGISLRPLLLRLLSL
jgi:hypothetical protein